MPRELNCQKYFAADNLRIYGKSFLPGCDNYYHTAETMETCDDDGAAGGACQTAAPPLEHQQRAPAAPPPQRIDTREDIETELSHEVVTAASPVESEETESGGALAQPLTEMASATTEQTTENEGAEVTVDVPAKAPGMGVMEDGTAANMVEAAAVQANGSPTETVNGNSSVPPKPRKMGSISAPRRLRSGSGSGSNSQSGSTVGAVLKRSGRDRTSSGNSLSAVSGGGTSGGIVVGSIRRRHRTSGLGRQESSEDDETAAAAADAKKPKRTYCIRIYTYTRNLTLR